MPRPESPYRRPAVRRRPARDTLDALVSFACLACVGAGAGGALGAAAYRLATGSTIATAFVAAGALLCFAGAAGAVVLDGGRR